VLHVPESLSVDLLVHDCLGWAPTNPAAGRQRPESEG
jgi:hypothetical protein